MNSAKAIVCGGRDYQDRERVYAVLDRAVANLELAHVVEGGATGADALAQEWAIERGLSHTTIKADWRDLQAPNARPMKNARGEWYNAAAGHHRNGLMLDEQPDYVIAFPGGKGTANMIKQATDRGVQVYQIMPTRSR